MRDFATIHIIIEFPYGEKTLRQSIPITRDAFAPFRRLPRDRELPFGESGREQELFRLQTAALLGKQLAEGILKTVQSDDTVMGYEPKEWKEIHREL